MNENEIKTTEKKSKTMAIGIGAATLIGSGIAAAGQAGNTIAAGKINKKSRQFQREMFDKTNAYNHPLAQRERLESAGLNPNLVYGGSSGGTAGTAAQPAKPDFNVPDFGAIGETAQTGLSQYYNRKAIQAGIDVNEARTDEIKQNTINKGIDSVTKAINTSKDFIDYKTKKRLFQNTIDKAEQQLENLGIQGSYTQNKDAREERVTQETVKKLRQETANLSQEGIMKKIDATIQKDYGIKPNDPHYYRIMIKTLEMLDDARTRIFGGETLKNRFKQ